jgi:hypothetical protein
MRYLTTLLVALLIGGCSKSPAPQTDSASANASQVADQGPKNSSVDSVQDFLLTTAASDLHSHGPSRVLRFRDVHFRYVVSQAGDTVYLMCGQFLPEKEGRKTEWIPFAAIKTDPYEQWIGAQATPFCGESSPVSGKADDLSSLLQSRFDSLE